MKIKTKNNGSVLIVVVFAIALLTAFVAGMLQINVEQIQLMKNEIFAAQATAIAEAGLADAFSQIRSSPSWPTSFSNSNFGGGSYDVIVTGSPPTDVNSTGTSAQGFKARVRAYITIGGTSPSRVIRIDKLRINE
jgi:Tfp pilus assembly protein PilX